MEVIFSPKAANDLSFWRKSGNKAIQNNIKQQIFAIQQDPYHGIGKPEPLKHELSGSWSRRINQEHRIIYEIQEENTIVILEVQSLKGH